MGLDVFIAGAAVALGPLVEQVSAGGLPCLVAMVDGNLVAPGRPLPERWQDVRLRTPAGTVTLRREPGGIRVIVFGNADEALVAAQQTIAQRISTLAADAVEPT